MGKIATIVKKDEKSIRAFWGVFLWGGKPGTNDNRKYLKQVAGAMR